MPRFLLAVAMLLAWALPVSHAAAASADDLVGTWIVDSDATWEKMKGMAEIKALSTEQQAMAKSMLATQMESATFEFTTAKVVSSVAGEKKEETYAVTKTEGDTLFTDDTASDGKVSHSKVVVGKDKLELTDTAEPTHTVVLKRKVK